MLEGNSAYDVNNNKIENILLSIKIEQQNRINQSSNPHYNNFQEKLIEIIDDMLINTPQVNEENITNRITDNLQIRNEIIAPFNHVTVIPDLNSCNIA